MCGPDVSDRSAFTWRNNCHLQDANISLSANNNHYNHFRTLLGRNSVDLSGGFHDAGDHVKFNLPIAYAAVTVAWSVHEFRAEFEKVGSLAHVERILHHFAEYYRKCVFWNSAGTAPIALAYQVGDGGGGNDHGFWGPPEQQRAGVNPAPSGVTRHARFTDLTSAWPGSDQVYMAAAVLASIAHVFPDSPTAAENIRHARALFNWANSGSTHNGRAQAGGSINSFDNGFYVSSLWQDKRALAGEWLRLVTGDNSFRTSDSISANHTNFPMNWDGVWPQVAAMRGAWSDVRTGFMTAVNERTNNPNTYWRPHSWGGARFNASFQMLGLIHDKNSPSNARYSEWSNGQMRFLLGANQRNNTYVIGYPTLGTGTPEHSGVNGERLNVHHRAATGFTAPSNGGSAPPNSVRPVNLLTGGLIGGPDSGTNGSFRNEYNSYVNSEVACDYNAGLVGAAAGHLRINPAHQPVPESSIPGGPFRQFQTQCADGHTPGPPATCGTPQTCTVCGFAINPATGNHTRRQSNCTQCSVCNATNLARNCQPSPCEFHSTVILYNLQEDNQASQFAGQGSSNQSTHALLRSNGATRTVSGSPPNRTITITSRGGTSQGIDFNLPDLNNRGAVAGGTYRFEITGRVTNGAGPHDLWFSTDTGENGVLARVSAATNANFTLTHTMTFAQIQAIGTGRFRFGGAGPLSGESGGRELTITGIIISEVQQQQNTVPGEPQNLSTTAGNGQITFNWTAPANNGGSPIIRYEVAISDEFWVPPATFTWIPVGMNTSHTFTGLTNGTLYGAYVRAVNSVGSGGMPGIMETPVGPPTAPLSFTATAGNAQVVLAWTAPTSSGGAAITRYEVSSNNGSTWATVSGGSLATTHTVTGLTNGTQYTFLVRAVSSAGNGASSVPQTATPQAEVTPPTAPLNFTATPGNGQITLSWTAPANAGIISPITSYEVSRNNGLSWVTVSGGANAESYTFSGLTNGQEYTFQVRAVNSAGNGAQASQTATPSASIIDVNWIQIHNNTGVSTPTRGLFLTDTDDDSDPEELYKWQIPNKIIRQAIGTTIQVSSNNHAPTWKRGRTNFNIKSVGGILQLWLIAANGEAPNGLTVSAGS
jgi:hypothetical protein